MKKNIIMLAFLLISCSENYDNKKGFTNPKKCYENTTQKDDKIIEKDDVSSIELQYTNLFKFYPKCIISTGEMLTRDFDKIGTNVILKNNLIISLQKYRLGTLNDYYLGGFLEYNLSEKTEKCITYDKALVFSKINPYIPVKNSSNNLFFFLIDQNDDLVSYDDYIFSYKESKKYKIEMPSKDYFKRGIYRQAFTKSGQLLVLVNDNTLAYFKNGELFWFLDSKDISKNIDKIFLHESMVEELDGISLKTFAKMKNGEIKQIIMDNCGGGKLESDALISDLKLTDLVAYDENDKEKILITTSINNIFESDIFIINKNDRNLIFEKNCSKIVSISEERYVCSKKTLDGELVLKIIGQNKIDTHIMDGYKNKINQDMISASNNFLIFHDFETGSSKSSINFYNTITRKNTILDIALDEEKAPMSTNLNPMMLSEEGVLIIDKDGYIIGIDTNLTISKTKFPRGLLLMNNGNSLYSQ